MTKPWVVVRYEQSWGEDASNFHVIGPFENEAAAVKWVTEDRIRTRNDNLCYDEEQFIELESPQ